MDLVLRRLPYLLDAEPRLAFMAAPFIKDREEARRLVGAYRGSRKPLSESIPVSLTLGLIDARAAVEELFAPSASGAGDMTIDRDLIRKLFALLQDDESRDFFRRMLFQFSGAITADADQDGIPESRARYREGVMEEFSWDADQDGLGELAVFFDAGGLPQWAEQVTLPESLEPAAGPAPVEQADLPAGRVFAIPAGDGERTKALIFWEQYPGVLRAELEGVTYIPAPGEFLFGPIRFTALAEGGAGPGLLYPLTEPWNIRISRRTLVSFSRTILRPSGEFEGVVERIDLLRGIPLQAVEILEGRPVAVTEFVRGKPVTQRIDLDLDGRMETIRRFQDEAADSGGLPDYKKIIRFSESDWDGDGIFETGEQYLSDGTVVYSWDMDGDGEREYSEIKAKE
jgi:hypothetical protein